MTHMGKLAMKYHTCHVDVGDNVIDHVFTVDASYRYEEVGLYIYIYIYISFLFRFALGPYMYTVNDNNDRSCKTRCMN